MLTPSPDPNALAEGEALRIADKLTAPQRRVLELAAREPAGDGKYLCYALKRGDWQVHDRLCRSDVGLLRQRHLSADHPPLTPKGVAVLAALPKAKPANVPKPPKHARDEKGVALAWKEGRTMSLRTMSTDGKRVWSYRLVIGYTDSRGKKIAVDYSGRISVGTSRQCNLVKREADRVLAPEQVRSKEASCPRITRRR